MGRRGRELLRQLETRACAVAQQDVMNYITMWYNSHRLHSYLGYKSPNQFELEMQMPRLELQKAS
jgi:transposase InsO family protein